MRETFQLHLKFVNDAVNKYYGEKKRRTANEVQNMATLNLNKENFKLYLLCLHLIYYLAGGGYGWERRNKTITPLKDIIFTKIVQTDFTSLILCGHSMGAGLAYLLATKLIEEKGTLLAKTDFDFKNLYVCTTGLGCLNSALADRFKGYYERYQFNCVDLIAIHKTPSGKTM